MKRTYSNSTSGLLGVALIIAFSGGALASEAEPIKSATKTHIEPSVADNASTYIRDYLSDPRRAGSLAGSILGGALTAHPAGPVIGSLVGFFVGKKTMFNEEKAKAQQAKILYARRDIVPEGGMGGVQTLSLSSAQGVIFDSATVAAVGDGKTSSGMSPEMIATKGGGNAKVDPRMRALCFYSQGS